MSPRRPVRILHLGLGAFFRAHQAWYTDAAPDAEGWGIAAFTGRSPDLARLLAAQDGRYTLVERGASHDHARTIGSVVEAYPGTDHEAWLRCWTRPDLAVVTLTVTEAGYARAADGSLDVDAVRADVDAIRAGGPVRTVPGRLVVGLAARRAAGLGPVAVVPCDNLPGNGAVTAHVVTATAALVDPDLAAWIGDNVSFVTTMVDRITPATTPDDVRAVAALTGLDDAAPVVTEPFSEWVLSGDLPAGRPAWEEAGARFVADVGPHERRKLWLLNGGHSLLAYAAGARGHQTVAEAVADPSCRRRLDEWWDDAARYLPLPAAEVAAYRGALLERWANPRIRHRLAQIAADGSQKIPVRVLPVLRRARAEGRLPAGAVRVLAAWISHLRGIGAPVDDAGAAPFVAAAASVRAVVALLDVDLSHDDALVTAVEAVL